MKKIIISSGRSGSTWLAKMLNSLKNICIISDLIEPCGHNLILENKLYISGQEFDLLLNHSSHKERSWYWNNKTTHERLYTPKNKTEYSLLESYTIPFLNLDVRETQEKITQMLRNRGITSCKEHLLSVFDLLTTLSGNQEWIERTGGSLMEAEKILKNFPEAKYIILERDIKETAQSMSKYPFFRLYHRLKNSESLSYPEMYADVDPKKFASDISKDVRNCKTLMSQYNCNYSKIDYSELKADTCNTLRKICSFFEITVNENSLKNAVKLFPPKQ